jgi:ATP-dependent RNA helicase DHX29
MAKKKKKPISNPDRGFATSSVASKSKKEHVEDEETEKKPLPVAQEDGVADGGITPANKLPEATPGTALHKMTPEELEQELERNDLQLFVETHAPRISREAQRQISRIQTESRVLRAQAPRLNLSPWLTEELVEDILVATKKNQEQTSAAEAPRKISEETWVSRLWFLYQVLQGIGISKNDSLFALERLQLKESSSDTTSIAWGVKECFEILALECNQVQLPAYGGPKILNEASNVASSPPPSGLTSPAAAQSKTPSVSGTSTPLRTEVVQDFEVSDYDSDVSPEELADIYVATKSRLFGIDPQLADATSARKRTKSQPGIATPRSGGVRKLTDRLQQIVSDTLFDKDDADRKWAVERIKLARERALQRRLIESQETSGSDTDRQSASEPPPPVVTDSSNNSDDGILGDMFLAPDEASTTRLSDGTGLVTLRNFGKATGFNPRRLLEDACRARYVLPDR